MCNSRGVEVAFGWIPRHVGIEENEVVDQLAKAALSHNEVNFEVILGYEALVVVENVMLEK